MLADKMPMYPNNKQYDKVYRFDLQEEKKQMKILNHSFFYKKNLPRDCAETVPKINNKNKKDKKQMENFILKSISCDH